MRYMLLIYSPADNAPAPGAAENAVMFAAYGAFTQELQAAGAMLAGEALQPATTATTVRVRDGKALLSDGPFAETREQLGGFYMVNCKDIDEALKWAAKIPGAASGSVEVRPILEFGE